MNEKTPDLISKRFLLGVSFDEFVKSFGTALIIVLFVTTFFQMAIVEGESMEPTLHEGDVVLVSRMSRIKRNDIVIAKPKYVYVIKRAVGVPGDDFDGVLKDGYYYIMGDNRDHSYDSRNYGSTNTIKGKVICRILPNPTTDLRRTTPSSGNI